MINIILIIPVLASFFVTLFLLPLWINKSKEIGLVWTDMNKWFKKEVSGSGGVVVTLRIEVGSSFVYTLPFGYEILKLSIGD